ncbi:MAG: PspC domain-containing protein [Flavobacteriaceae bacterium]|jgi:phage shock protein PspC (stress-responsive transcriptional regulator)|nr:PspC domain-containing protein [Flavobacteriaceae bacterium]
MNKTVNINLASIFFQIDEDAYKSLDQYLRKLKSTFSKTEGSDEIMKEIEGRIAELFQEFKKHKDYVINQNDVSKMIGILGTPEDFLMEEEPSTEQKQNPTEKKLFRDPDDRYIGGVASGIAHYFAIDCLWIRLLWVLLTFISGGVFVLIYLVLWALVPKAETTADKLKMKGEPVDIANIERKVKEGFEEVKEKISRVDYEKAKSTAKKKSKNFFNFLESLFRVVFRVISKIIGIVLMVSALVVVITLSISFASFAFFGNIEWPLVVFDQWYELSFFPLWVFLLLLLVSIIIPFVFVFMLGVKIINPKAKPFGYVAIFMLSLWLVSILFMGLLGANECFVGHDLIYSQ